VRRDQLRIALLSIEGTNNDEELLAALRALGTQAEVVQLKQFEGRDVERSQRRDLFDYQTLFIPGGFSAGDYVRAGAIFAARVRATMGPSLEEFIRAGHLVGGVCNGFQVLTELGLLPGRADGRLGKPQAALMTNDSGHHECRPTFLRWEGGRFAPLRSLPAGQRYLIPSSHTEGKLILSGEPGARLDELEENGQILFRYVQPDGRPAEYPWNPNGSVGDIAAITNPTGNVFGIMPHPERSFYRIQHPDWTRTGGPEGPGDGHLFLESIVQYAEIDG
jgi:phosphoribosylformylglycinamidine synthase subunit PurQ / glutaminase